jgi:carboxylate-amine ligase
LFADGTQRTPLGPHRFGRSFPYSLGIEEEFQILDRDGLGLVSKSDDLLAELRPQDTGDHVKRELYQSVVEISTGIARTVVEAVDELIELRARLGAVAAARGALIASAGTHPFSSPDDQQVTRRFRYRRIAESMRWVTRRGLVFGLHIHVGVESPQTAIACANGLRTVLAELLALSANSPFWQGQLTGLASNRAKIFEGFPRSGIPPAFGSFEEFEELVERGMRTHCFPEYTHIWWDVRPHPALGTVELRVCDAQTRIENVGALAALTQSLVATFAAEHERAGRMSLQPALLLEENKWRATRDGLRAVLIDLADDSERPASDATRDLADRSRPAAKRLGCEPELDEIERILERGGGAGEQLCVYEETGDVRAVAAWVAEETAKASRVT